MELSLANNSFIAEPGRTVELKVRVDRDAKLTEPTTVELVCPAHLPVARAAAVSIPAQETAGVLTIQFPAGPLPAINMPVAIRATTKDERGFPVVTEMPLELVPPKK